MVHDLFPPPLTDRTVHLCIDMQRIFSAEGPWTTPWMERVLPVVAAIAQRFPERTVFTRFITPQRPDDCRELGGTTIRSGARLRASTSIRGFWSCCRRLRSLFRRLRSSTKPATQHSRSRSSWRIYGSGGPTVSSSRVRRRMFACWRRSWAPSISVCE